jgi:hypothetical protein
MNHSAFYEIPKLILFSLANFKRKFLQFLAFFASAYGQFGRFLGAGNPDQKSFYGKEVDEYSNKSLFSAFPFFVYNKKKK